MRADGAFLVLSDLHFDPFLDPDIFGQLQQAEVDQWPRILAASDAKGQKPGTDSSFALVRSALDDAATRIPKPDFILCPGDLLAHYWQQRFDKLAPGVRDRQPEVFQQFTMKAVRLLANELRQRFPEVPVLPTLGNEDAFCDDYELTPGGQFLRDFAEVWSPLLHLPPEKQQVFQQTFARAGYYELPLPRVLGLRMVVLNSVFFSTEFFDACETPHQQPSGEQLAWLEKRLRDSENAGERVWLLMHIPPGIDAFATARQLRKGGRVVPFWHDDYTQQFIKLADRYRGTLVCAIAGHTHMDDFRIPLSDNKPTVPFKLVPAISPVFGNNPAYQVFEYRRNDGQICNYRAFYLPLSSQHRRGDERSSAYSQQHGRKPAGNTLPNWREEYSYRRAYGYQRFDAASLVDLARRLESQAEVIQRYRAYYNSSAPLAPDSDPWPITRAAILEALPEPFRQRLGPFPPAD